MRSLLRWPFPLTILQTGGLCLALFWPASLEADCESAERFCMSLLLATILLCMALCCLQRWLTWCRRFSSQRTVAVFALSDVDSVYEKDVAPGMLPKVLPHLQSLERNTSGDGSPPSYQETVRHLSAWPASPSLRDVHPGEQPSRGGPVEPSQPSRA